MARNPIIKPEEAEQPELFENTETAEQQQEEASEDTTEEASNEPSTEDAPEETVEETVVAGSVIYNADGYRCFVKGPSGKLMKLDDETAKVLYTDPYTYSYLYDEGNGRSMHVSQFIWTDEEGAPISGNVGKSYQRN